MRLRQSIAAARRLDLSYLPDSRRRAFADGLDAADATFERMSPRCARRRRTLAAMRPSYKPVHREVRSLQAGIRRLAEEQRGAGGNGPAHGRFRKSPRGD